MNTSLLAVALVAALSTMSVAHAAAPPEAQRLLADGHANEALSLIESHLAQNPQDADARLARGIALTRLNRYAEAEREFNDLVNENPLRAPPYRELGLLYLRQGDAARARSALETATKLAPGDAAAQAGLGDAYLALSGDAYSLALGAGRKDSATRGKQRGVERLLAGDYPDTDMVVEPALGAPVPLGETPVTATNLAPAPIAGAADNPATADISQFLKDWLAAWMSKDIDAYLACYADDFRPEIEPDRASWAQGRRNTIIAAHALRVTAESPRLTLLDATHARLRFEQHYRADLYNGTSIKTLDLAKTAQGWRITRERVESD